LANQLNEVIKLEPKHQKELLDLEKQAQELQSSYDENIRKANDPNTSAEDKTKFLLLANEEAKKANVLKSKIKANPLADLSRFSNLDDLNILLKGNVSKKTLSSNKPNSSNSSQNTSNFNQNLTNPENNQQLLIFAGIALLILFYFYTQNQENYDY
jgi:hypothetical protein